MNDSYFDKIDTPDKAYIFGLLCADGTIYASGRVKIDLTDRDIQILEDIKNKIGFTGEIKIYKANYKGRYSANHICRLTFISHHMVEELISKGCTNNKSLTFKFPYSSVPKSLYGHFIRGLFDGNGSISCWIDNSGTGHKKFNFRYCGTIEVVNSLFKIFSNKFNCNPTITPRWTDRDNNNVDMVICGNRLIQRIMDWLYEDATIYIQRKYDKYIELIKQNESSDNKTIDDLKGIYPPRRVIDVKNMVIYESVSDASRKIGVSTGTISYRCKNHAHSLMYYDDWKGDAKAEA